MTSPRTSTPLTRSSSDKKIGGVSAGLGQYFDIDPVLFRVGFAVTAFTGFGVLAYLVLLVVLPTDAASPEPAQPLAT